jgi:extradiol dioxygenase family protein
MADDRRENGGARPGAGRKPKADEIKLIEQMDAVMLPVEAWQALAAKVESGDVQAQKTWLSYRYGMPKQMIEQTTINIDAGKLTDEEIKKINDSLEQSY